MKKNKLLTFIAGMLLTTTMAGCNEVTAKEGVAVTFTDANGVIVEYTAEDLFRDYQSASSTASTDFSTVKEILIRQYFLGRSSELAILKTTAQNKVDGIKAQAQKNANSNGTAYATELEALLSGEGVKNIDELFEKKLYDAELEKFEADYKSGWRLEGMRDGFYSTDTKVDAALRGKAVFPESQDFGIGNKGYLKTNMPYNVSHILLEVSSSEETNATSATITEGEAKTLADVGLMMAGANTTLEAGLPTPTSGRASFGQLAKTYSKDTGSGEKFGNLGIMDLTTSFVQGFQYGVYAYDTIYTQHANYSAEDKATIQWSNKATYRNGTGEEVSLDTAAATGGVLSEVGQIPFGAFVALANEDVQKNFPRQTFQPNEGNTAYFPRNVIWNKYFNSHRIAVVTPNDIEYAKYLREGTSATYVDGDGKYDMASEVAAWKGTLSASYAALPGFKHDTKGILPNIGSNVLTNEKGQVILAVRGDSGTKGVHFITIDRSALSEFGSYVDADGKVAEYTLADHPAENNGNKDCTTLSEFYTFKNPVTDASEFPTFTVNGVTTNRTTFVTMGLDTTKVNYQSNIDTLKSKVSGFNSNLDSYMLQFLVESTGAKFNTSNALVKDIMENIYKYSSSKREKSADDARTALDSAWTKYAEFLVREDNDRTMRPEGDQKLISEAAAILYNSTDARDGTGAWGHGGACYMKK